MTSRWLPSAAALAACVLVAAPLAGAGSPSRRVAQVFLTGHGTVTSMPRGITCPRTCRAVFARGSDLRVVAHPAAGWRFAGWGGMCSGTRSACTFQLESSHDCAARVCTIAVFDVRARFTPAP